MSFRGDKASKWKQSTDSKRVSRALDKYTGMRLD